MAIAATYSENPVPSVLVDVTSIPAYSGVKRITIYRIANNAQTIVRNANSIDISGSATFFIQDFDVPLGVPVQYKAYIRNNTGLNTNQTTLTATYQASDASIWITDPLNTSNFVKVATSGTGDAVLGQNSFTKVARSYEKNTSSVIGRSKPVLQFYGEKALTDLPLEIIAGPSASDQIEALLQTGHVLIRTNSRMVNLPRELYCTMTGEQEPLTWNLSGFDAGSDLTKWTLTVDEVEAQTLDIVLALYSYDYWAGKYATYADAVTAYGTGTYLNAMKNPPA